MGQKTEEAVFHGALERKHPPPAPLLPTSLKLPTFEQLMAPELKSNSLPRLSSPWWSSLVSRLLSTG